MAGTSQGRFIYSLRSIPDEIDRAKLRTTLLYLFSDRVRAGVEWNPLAKDASLLVNLHVMKETKHRPAMIFGLSSDRIGTPSGKSLFLTASRAFKLGPRVSIAPYAGLAHGTYEDKTRAIGGLSVRLSSSLSALAIFDGVHLHEVITLEKGRHALSAVLVRNGRKLGVSYNVVF